MIGEIDCESVSFRRQAISPTGRFGLRSKPITTIRRRTPSAEESVDFRSNFLRSSEILLSSKYEPHRYNSQIPIFPCSKLSSYYGWFARPIEILWVKNREPRLAIVESEVIRVEAALIARVWPGHRLLPCYQNRWPRGRRSSSNTSKNARQATFCVVFAG